MRVDEAHHILGLRLNVWTAIVVFVLAVVYIVLSAKLRPGPRGGRRAGGGASRQARRRRCQLRTAADATTDADAGALSLDKDPAEEPADRSPRTGRRADSRRRVADRVRGILRAARLITAGRP